MNGSTDTYPAAPRATGEDAPQFRAVNRQLPGTQPSGADLSGVHDLPPLVEPVYDPTAGLDFGTESLADHPLLRGLLMELPPKGSQPPSPEWLDRWFEATRSILELLYSQGSHKGGI